MKTLAFTAMAAAAALVASPAFAQASGTVDVNGTVASKCATVGTIAGTISLGELAKANGTIESAFANNSGGLSRQFTVRCTGANPVLSVNASPLVNGAIATPASGYTNTVHYTATLSASAAGTGGATASAADTSNVSGATTAALSGRLSAAANNVTLLISNGNTTDAAAVLEAGTYNGSVAVLVSPAA
jgi:hypothetical protein